MMLAGFCWAFFPPQSNTDNDDDGDDDDEPVFSHQSLAVASLPRIYLKCPKVTDNGRAPNQGESSHFIFSRYCGDRYNSLLKGLKFTFPTSLESATRIRGETGVGHFFSCRSSAGKGNKIGNVREKKNGYGYDAYWLGHSLARALASLPCSGLLVHFALGSYCMK